MRCWDVSSHWGEQQQAGSVHCLQRWHIQRCPGPSLHCSLPCWHCGPSWEPGLRSSSHAAAPPPTCPCLQHWQRPQCSRHSLHTLRPRLPWQWHLLRPLPPAHCPLTHWRCLPVPPWLCRRRRWRWRSPLHPAHLPHPHLCQWPVRHLCPGTPAVHAHCSAPGALPHWRPPWRHSVAGLPSVHWGCHWRCAVLGLGRGLGARQLHQPLLCRHCCAGSDWGAAHHAGWQQLGAGPRPWGALYTGCQGRLGWLM